MKDPDNPRRWIVDEEAAAVVRRIYHMCVEGNKEWKIACQLEADEVLKPAEYWRIKGIRKPGRKSSYEDRPCYWCKTTINKILNAWEYTGDVVNFKTYSKSFKDKRRHENTEENMVVFEGVHEPIIDRPTWEMVQRIREGTKRRCPKSTDRHLFSGLLYCADCGRKLHFNVNHPHTELQYFNCSNYRGNRGTCNQTHYIRADALEQVMLLEIRRMTAFLRDKEDDYLKILMDNSMLEARRENKCREKELRAMLARSQEIDGLFARTYEDNAAEKISDERFGKLSRKYEQEQGELGKRIKVLRAELKKDTSRLYTADSFLEVAHCYTDAEELTQRMVTELIDHIDVYHAKQENGQRTQEVIIHYNCIGAFQVPDRESIPELEAYIRTRKGVAISYASEKRAG